MEYKIRKCTEAGVKGGGKVMYCAVINYKGTKYIKDFVKYAEKRSTVTQSDIMAVLYNSNALYNRFSSKKPQK